MVGIQVKLDCLVFYSNKTYFAHFNNRTLFKVNSQLIGLQAVPIFPLEFVDCRVAKGGARDWGEENSLCASAFAMPFPRLEELTRRRVGTARSLLATVLGAMNIILNLVYINRKYTNISVRFKTLSSAALLHFAMF